MVPTLPLVLMWIKTHISSVRIGDPEHIDASSPSTYKSRYLRGDKTIQGTQ